MKKVLISNEYYPIELDNNLNPAPFEDYFVRLEKYEASKQSEINNEGLCCDCCESIR